MLGYRSLFTVDRASLHGGDISGLVSSQVRSWLRDKGLDADAVRLGSVVDVGSGAEASLSYEDTVSGSHSSRFLLTEASGWMSQVIVHDPRDGRHDPWVWIDITSPNDQTVAKAPRLAKMILQVVEAHDGGAVLDPKVRTLRSEDVPTLIAALKGSARRGPVFVAGSSNALPLEPWRNLIGTLLRDTTGLAAGFVLDPAATEEFERRTGFAHAVAPGTLRTFVREVDFDDALDGRRHRILTTERIAHDREVHLLRILGRVARDHTLTNPLPPSVARVEARLIRQADVDFLASVRTVPINEKTSSSGEAETAVASQLVATQDALDLQRSATSLDIEQGTLDLGDEAALLSTPPSALQPHLKQWKAKPRGPLPHQAMLHEAAATAELTATREAVTHDGGIMAALRRLFGADGVTPEAIETLGARAAQVEPLRALVKRKDDAEQALQDTIGNLRAQNKASIDQRDDMTLEWQEQAERVRRLSAELAALQKAAAEAGYAAVAWSDHLAGDDVEVLAPESFEDLLLGWSTVQESGSLARVVWTGESSVVLELDEHGPAAGWAGLTWSVLKALDDYARVSAVGAFSGSVEDYLRDTPPGCQTLSAGRHATLESEGVRNNDKYATPRLLPVPTGIDPSGRKHMWAHFKISNYATVAPRIHYLDATAIDGNVYVGYIGRHLPLPNVN